ncbi:hypothetical protein HN51_069703, partial [Arachis hypogaea]
VSVYPREVLPENPKSYRARKREYFRMRRKRKKAREAGAVANLHERFDQHRHVLSWPKTLVNKWLNIKCKTDNFQANDDVDDDVPYQ